MIDTVILTIPWGKFMITDHKKFSPSTENLAKQGGIRFGARGFAKYTQNPTKAEYLQGNYKPKLTITDRAGVGTTLKIEFSVPKLIFGNNLDEVVEADFSKVIELLSIRLKEMGIRILLPLLENAPVSAVHFSKNIPLSNRYTASSAIKELGKLDVTKRLEINNRHFQNDGHALYFDCGSYQIVIYDKLRDIKKTPRQAVDKDRTLQQLNLFEAYQKTKADIELLRLEIRITNKQKMNSLLNSFGFTANPTFREILREKVSKSFLVYYWNTISSDKTKFVLAQDEDFEKLLTETISYLGKKSKKPQVKTALALFGLITFAKAEGIRPLRNIIDSNFTNRTWLREGNNLLTQASEISSRIKPFGFVSDIEKALDTFEPHKSIRLKGEQS